MLTYCVQCGSGTEQAERQNGVESLGIRNCDRKKGKLEEDPIWQMEEIEIHFCMLGVSFAPLRPFFKKSLTFPASHFLFLGRG